MRAHDLIVAGGAYSLALTDAFVAGISADVSIAFLRPCQCVAYSRVRACACACAGTSEKSMTGTNRYPEWKKGACKTASPIPTDQTWSDPWLQAVAACVSLLRISLIVFCAGCSV